MNTLEQYIELESGNLFFNGMTIPNNVSNRHYLELVRKIGKKVVTVESESGEFLRYELQEDPDLPITAEVLPFDHAEQDNLNAIAGEREWRNAELNRADIELNKVQDGASGTVGEWRDYRNDLRDWPEHLNFPDSVYRPKAPDA